MQMQDPHHELSDPDQQIIETLIDEHIHVSYDVVPIDDETWAIHASIAVDGEVIVAEFHDRADAETALEAALCGRARSHRRRDVGTRLTPSTPGGRIIMKVVVIGGTGLIGSKVVVDLQGAGHDAVAASPDSGVNTLTGDGLADVLEGAAVVIDVSNSPSFEDAEVLHFFETSTRHILDAPTNAASAISWCCRSSGANACPAAATCAPRSRRSGSSRHRPCRSRSSTRRSSSSSSHASQTTRRTGARFECRRR